jgi:hypothetical protein
MPRRLRGLYRASRCHKTGPDMNARVLDGRDHLWRFLPGAGWKKLPDCFKAPNRGRRLTPRRRVAIECFHCGNEVERHRRSARYCSIECRRRAQFERDALRKGRPLPKERARGAARQNRALVKGSRRRYGSVAAYLRAKAERKRRQDTCAERQSHKGLSPQEEWANHHWSGPALQNEQRVGRYVLVGR